MKNIKLTIQYDGTNFHGWQIQPKAYRTVQGEIKKVLEKICKENITLIGSGRTDTGVHALGQVANFKTRSLIDLKTLQKALNHNLPRDIVISKAQKVPSNFHAQYSVKTKTYRYTVLNRRYHSPKDRHHVLFYPYPLDLKLMKDEAKTLIGKKNFRSFQTNNGNALEKQEDSIRTVKSIKIRKKGSLIEIDIEADGFLYKMVRTIVGTLLEIGKGSLPKGSMKIILAKKDRKFAGVPAQACGLSLLAVKY